MKSKPKITDHEVNGFIDNELDSAGRAQVLSDACGSAEINNQIADYRRMKDLVKNAYANLPTPRSEMRHEDPSFKLNKGWFNTSSMGFWPAMGLSLLLIVGVVSGAHVMLNQTILGPNTALPHIQTAAVAETNSAHFLLHLSSNEYTKMDLVLTRAENLLASNPINSALKIEVIANSNGIDLMREDTSPFKARISKLAEQGVLFEACARTIEQMHKNLNPTLFAEVNVSMTAMQRVANGVKHGGIYESI